MSGVAVPPATLAGSIWMPRLVVSVSRYHRWGWWGEAGAVVVLAATAMAVLGMPSFNVHEPTHFAGIMSPTCGVTRSVVAVFRGDPATAWRYNPLGFAVAAVALSGVIMLAVGLLRKRWLLVRVRPGRCGWGLLVVILVLLEIRQQGRADLLMSSGFR